MAIFTDPKISDFVMSVGFHAMRLLERRPRGKAGASLEQLRQLRRFLFLEYQTALGSNVHATPVYEAIKLAAPDVVTMVACSRMAFEVFKHNPFIDYLVETPRPATHTIQAIRCLRGHLKATGFVPEVLVTSKGNEPRGTSLLSFFAGKGRRVGYTFAPELYDEVLWNDGERSLIDNNLRLIERLGHGKGNVEPRVSFSAEDLEKAHRFLQQGGAEEDQPRVVFITQTSPTQRKSWPRERFVTVANYVINTLGASAVFVGTEKESAGIDSIRSEVKGKSISLAGQTTISQLAAVLSLCDHAITLDTGNMHIARAVGLPMVILAPAWQPVIEWLPLGHDQYRIFKGDDIPKAPPDYIMDEIGVEEVVRSLDDLVLRYPASKQSRGARVKRSLAQVSAESRLQLQQS